MSTHQPEPPIPIEVWKEFLAESRAGISWQRQLREIDDWLQEGVVRPTAAAVLLGDLVANVRYFRMRVGEATDDSVRKGVEEVCDRTIEGAFQLADENGFAVSERRRHVLQSGRIERSR